MIRFLYTLGIRFYACALKLASLRNAKAKAWILGRKNLLQDLAQWRDSDNAKVLWFHSSSLGEFEQGRPLIEAIKQKYPEYKILLTFFSPSGYEIRKNYQVVDKVCYLPLDTPHNACEFIAIVQPSIAFFIKYEYWYNFLIELHKNAIPVFYISAKFRSKQYFFKGYAKWFVSRLKEVDCFFVQDKESEQLLKSIGVTRVYCSGDTRFDRVAEIQNSIISYPWLSTFKGDACLLIGGSTWWEDEVILADCFKSYEDRMKYLLVPHEINSKHIEKIKELFSAFVCSTFSDMEKQQFDQIEKVQILIVDKIGFLSHLYKYGDIAFIGGGFGKGIHNVLEAAVFGMPILFGPQYEKFTEAIALLENGAAFSVKGKIDVSLHLNKWISKSEDWKFATLASKTYVNENRGALLCILNEVAPYFERDFQIKG